MSLYYDGIHDGAAELTRPGPTGAADFWTMNLTRVSLFDFIYQGETTSLGPG